MTISESCAAVYSFRRKPGALTAPEHPVEVARARDVQFYGDPQTPWVEAQKLVPYYGLFFILNFLDVMLTLFMMDRGAVETNPMCLMVMHHYGTGGFILYKMLQCLFVMGITHVIYNQRAAAGRAVILLGCTLYFILMLWDVALLGQMF